MKNDAAPRMMPGQEPYSQDELHQLHGAVATACQAEEEVGIDELDDRLPVVSGFGAVELHRADGTITQHAGMVEAIQATRGPGQPAPPAAGGVAVENLRVKVLAEHRHDPGAFCQGLVWHDGVLFESTGQYGRSSLRRVEPLSGAVLVSYPLDPLLFGEGLALVDGRLVQLTYQASLIYDAKDLVPLDQRVYTGEGWGLAYDGKRLVMSDGSSRLTFRDPQSFELQGTLEVRLDGRPVPKLNELEVVDGAIYANVWMADWIARIVDREEEE